jgi:hypothetical protein
MVWEQTITALGVKQTIFLPTVGLVPSLIDGEQIAIFNFERHVENVYDIKICVPHRQQKILH